MVTFKQRKIKYFITVDNCITNIIYYLKVFFEQNTFNVAHILLMLTVINIIDIFHLIDKSMAKKIIC